MKYIIVISALIFSAISVQAQFESDDPSFNYDHAWSFAAKLRSDGWMVSGEYTQTLHYRKHRIFMLEMGGYKHPKQKKRSRDPNAGIFGSNGRKPYVYGKQNSLFATHLLYGYKHMVAERGRKNGVMINVQYMGGLTLGFLKPYVLKICNENRPCQNEFETATVSYQEGEDNGFLDDARIWGFAGFGSGFRGLSVLPGAHGRIGFQFDWSTTDNFIKAIEVGASVDVYIKKVPILVNEVKEKNRFLFPNVYVGFQLGKKIIE